MSLSDLELPRGHDMQCDRAPSNASTSVNVEVHVNEHARLNETLVADRYIPKIVWKLQTK